MDRWYIPVEEGAYPFQSLRGAMKAAKEFSSRNINTTYQIYYLADHKCYVEFRNGHCVKDRWHPQRSSSVLDYLHT